MQFNALRFEGKTEYIEYAGGMAEADVGQLILSILDTDFHPMLQLANETERKLACCKTEGITIGERMQAIETCPYYAAAAFSSAVKDYFKNDTHLLHLFAEQRVDYFRYSFDTEQEKLSYEGDIFDIVSNIAQEENWHYADWRIDKLRELGDLCIRANILQKLIEEYPGYKKSLYGFEDVEEDTLSALAIRFVADVRWQLEQLIAFQEDIETLLAYALDADGSLSELSVGQRYAAIPQKLINRYENANSLLMVQSRIAEENAYIGYHSENLCTLAFFEFKYMCVNDIRVRRCARCARYFLPFSKISRYCDRLADINTQKTCKDIAAMEKYTDKISQNEALALYRKRANTYQMRCSRAPSCYPHEDYESWKEHARRLLDLVNSGELSPENFDIETQIPEAK